MSVIATACQIAYYLIMGYGVYVCWRAYRSSQKRAWLLVGIFCLSAFFVLGMRQLSKAMYRSSSHEHRSGEGEYTCSGYHLSHEAHAYVSGGWRRI